MKKGDIVLIPFPFTDLIGVKNRPALILTENNFDLVVAFITPQVKWKETLDINLEPSIENGLKRTSLVRLSKLATVDKNLVIGRIGSLNKAELKSVDDNLKLLLKLS